MTDARDQPFRGIVDPLGPRSHRFEIPRPPPPPSERSFSVRPPFALAALALGVLGAVAGATSMAALFGGAGVAGVGDWIVARSRRRLPTTVDIHEHGLRVGVEIASPSRGIAWSAVRVVTIDCTPDQGRTPGTVAITTRDRTTAITGRAADLGPLFTAIEAAVGPRHHREAAVRLHDGHAISYGRHQFTSDGLMARDTGVPWRDLGPARRARGQLEIGSTLGAFTTPIAGVPNPWVVEALVAARGRQAP